MDQGFVNIVVKGDSMWPSFSDGDEILCQNYTGQEIAIGDLVVFKHPFKSSVTCVKRVKTISEKGLFVQGDNPDPLASEDSHNFGHVPTDSIIAIKRD